MNNVNEVSSYLYETLNSIGKLGSPMIHTHVKENLAFRSVYLSFRFEGMKLHDKIYLILINAITNFDGKVSWCMYNYKSRKNYVIEPLIFYSRRRELATGNDEKLISTFNKQEYLLLVQNAINDLPELCSYIKALNLSVECQRDSTK